MEYKTITRPDGSEQQLAVYDGKCRFWMEGIYDSLPDTAEKRAEECSLPVKIDRREDGTVSVGTQSLVPWETDYGKLEIMAEKSAVTLGSTYKPLTKEDVMNIYRACF